MSLLVTILATVSSLPTIVTLVPLLATILATVSLLPTTVTPLDLLGTILATVSLSPTAVYFLVTVVGTFFFNFSS